MKIVVPAVRNKIRSQPAQHEFNQYLDFKLGKYLLENLDSMVGNYTFRLDFGGIGTYEIWL